LVPAGQNVIATPLCARCIVLAAYAGTGKMDEARAAVAEARRLNPTRTVKSMIEHMLNFPIVVFDGVRKAGLPEE
jgi:hypothetical protein